MCWRQDGHEVLVHYGTAAPPPGDVAILNVDVSRVPGDYLALCARYPRVINGAAADISKSRYSQLLLTRDSGWQGAVMVKTDANCGGFVEQTLRGLAEQAGVISDIPKGPVFRDYRVLGSLRDVPQQVWETPGMVVEKFMPERDLEGNYYIRIWTFFGAQERCTRYGAPDPLVKAANVGERQSVEVPEEIREWRRRLGFDFGKFDFVEAAGCYWLLDANRTPGLPQQVLEAPGMRESCDRLAAGLYEFF